MNTGPGIGKPADKWAGNEALRRNVTVMFTDLVDFTPLAERIGEEGVYDLVRQLAGEQAAAIEAEGGALQDFAGDGIMALFGAPVALEEAALHACRAAINIRERLAQKQQDFEAEFGIAPRLRIGLHTGTAVVGRIGSDRALAHSALGDSVNVAARIQAAADPGTIFMSNATLELVGGFVEVQPKGDHRLKGKSEPYALFGLTGLRSDITRFGAKTHRGLSSFVGRDGDLDRLTKIWRESISNPLTAAGISGDAGIGKSRLIFEFKQTLTNEGGSLFEIACQPESRGTPFHPIVELIKHQFAITRKHSTAQTAQQLADRLDELGIDPQPVLPYLVHLFCGEHSQPELGAVPAAELVGVRTRQALATVLLGLARVYSPFLLVIEDLHWADGATLDVLGQLMSSNTEAHGLLIFSFRPEFTPPWADKNLAQIQLKPLSYADLCALFLERAMAEPSVDSRIDDAIAKAEGNPLFAEELAGYLSKERPADDLPARLENLIMGRVQRLNPKAQKLMQAASVVGREFAADVAVGIAELDGNIEEQLNLLEAEDLVYPAKSDHGQPGQFTFKHALVRDALYGSLLKAQRTQWHLAAAEALEARSVDEGTQATGLLARHFELGGEESKAVHYLAMTADKSLRLFSLTEALAALDHALNMVRSLPDCIDPETIADLVVKRLMIACWEADFTGMISIAEEFLPTIEQIGPSRVLSRTLAWLGEGYLNAERLEEAEAVLTRAHGIGVEIGCEESTAYAIWDLAWLQSMSPDNRSPDIFVERLDTVLEAAEKLNDVYLETLACFLYCNDALERGHIHMAQTWVEKLSSLSARTGYPPAQSISLFCSSLMASLCEDPDKALSDAEQCVSGAAGLTESQSGRCALGIAHLAGGRAQQSADILDQLTIDVNRSGFLVMLSASEIPRCVAHALGGDPLGAIEGLNNATGRFKRRGNMRLVATANLMLGEIYLAATSAPRPPIASLLRNPRLLLLGLAAPRRAPLHFEAAATLARQSGNQGTLLRALVGLGTIAIDKDKTRAKGYMMDARQIAETVGADAMATKIDKFLSQTSK